MQPHIWCFAFSPIQVSQCLKPEEKPLPVPARTREGLGFRKDDRPKPTHRSQHSRTPLCSCPRCIWKAPKPNLQMSVKQQQVVQLQGNGPLGHSTSQEAASSLPLLPCKSKQSWERREAPGERFVAVTTVRKNPVSEKKRRKSFSSLGHEQQGGCCTLCVRAASIFKNLRI